MANTLNLGNGNWATKEDSLLAYNSENGNFKPLPFDFTRASSATVVNKAGLIETVGSGEPRIDFSNDAKGALLLEPTRSNLVTYSEAFDNAAWIKVGGAITPNIGVSPDGSLNADRFYISTAAANTRLYINYTYSASTYTASVYAKNNGNTNTFRFSYADSGGQSFSPNFTLTNQWQRFEYTFTSVGGSGVFWFACVTSSTGVGSELDIQIFGAQLEQGSYATSYIPTQGSAVTRVADACSQTPPTGIIGQTEGTLFTEFEFNYSDSNTQVLLKANQSSDANSVGIEILGTTIKGLVNSQSLSLANIQGTIAIGKIKAAIAYKTNDIAFYVNGVQVGIISSGSIDFAGVVNILTIGHFSLNGGQYFPSSRPFNEAKLYNTRLSNAELQALTS